MLVRLSSLVPNANDLLTLDVEELAGVLLTHLNSYGGEQGGGINQYNFFNALDHFPEYPGRQPEVNQVLMEAWSWLQSEGFVVPEASHPTIFFLSRRAQRLKSRDDFAQYRKAGLLPKGQLHPLVAAKVYPAFLRGEYDTAVFQAFREIEVAVRRAGNFPEDLVGKNLMHAAFRPSNPQDATVTPGPLTDSELPVAEQQGMASLFAGAISLYKNPQSHRNVPTEAIDAAEVIVFASHLLRTVDRLSVNA